MKAISTVALALAAFSSSLQAEVVVNGETYQGTGWPKALSCPTQSGTDIYMDSAEIDARLGEFITNLIQYKYKPYDTTWNLAVGGACAPDKLKTSKPLWVIGSRGGLLYVAIDVKLQQFWFCGAEANVAGPSGYPLGCAEIND